MSPQRIQMTRQRPWRADHPDAVIVARPSKWGNPYWIISEREPGIGTVWKVLHGHWSVGPFSTRREAAALAAECFVTGLYDGHFPRLTVEDARRELRGRDLACWCPLDQPCHADALLEIANKEGD